MKTHHDQSILVIGRVSQETRGGGGNPTDGLAGKNMGLTND